MAALNATVSGCKGRGGGGWEGTPTPFTFPPPSYDVMCESLSGPLRICFSHIFTLPHFRVTCRTTRPLRPSRPCSYSTLLPNSRTSTLQGHPPDPATLEALPALQLLHLVCLYRVKNLITYLLFNLNVPLLWVTVLRNVVVSQSLVCGGVC